MDPLIGLLDPLWTLIGVENDSLTATALLVLGLVFVIVGFASKPTWDLKGGEDDPQEYLFTHRPKAFLWCLMMPWNSLTWFWQMKKVPVIIPIILIPFMFPFAVIADVILIVLFAIVWVAMTAGIKMAAKKDREQYEKDTQYAICPKCKRNFDRPNVKCKCGLVLSYPVPNEHGIKTHACNNGHIIPSTNKDGIRAKLQMVCPHCGGGIITHEAKPIVISMVGSVGSGKTTMMVSAVESISALAKDRGIVTDVITDGVSVNAQRKKTNIMPTKTGELDSQYFFLRSRDLPEKQIVINDISGIEFQPDNEKNLFEEYYRYNDGIIFAIDPLEVMALHHSQSPTKGSKNTPLAALESFYHMYTEINGYGPAVKSSVPFAIVLTRMDETKIKAAVDAEATPAAFLNKYSHGMVVDIAQSAFANVKYFKVASLGNDNNAMEPFLWILSENDEDLKNKLK
ncbi:GTPase domain-containing protein [Candidatus Methanoplasma termitum]|nr:GTPase domain-containing protein [Candidatus Methanoplasma termitum]MCL2333391.1 GTPase domain-containing protein [Candidatus Methanoplasma sp.]